MRPDDARHGTVAGYVAKCRQDCCRGAWRLNQRNLRARHYLAQGPLVIDATGTRRRLRALVAIGWSLKELDVEMGRAETYCSYLLRRQGEVFRSTAEEVAALYERLCMSRRTGWIADRQRRLAKARKWAPPLAWDDIDAADAEPILTTESESAWEDTVDPVVVQRFIDGGGRARKMTRAEGAEAVTKLLGRGLSTHQIEERYGLKPERYARMSERGVA